MAVFTSRMVQVQNVGPTLVNVSITGSGYEFFSFVNIYGTTYTSATSGIEVLTGDVITFGVAGANSGSLLGKVTIDGEIVASSSNGDQSTYEWTVPNGITQVTIALTYNSIGYGTITVTTS